MIKYRFWSCDVGVMQRLRSNVRPVSACGLLLLAASPSHAGLWCSMPSFDVHLYEDGRVVLEGTMEGVANTISICNGSGSTQTCDSRGTDRNVSSAITAKALGKPLKLYFNAYSSGQCGTVAIGTRAYIITF